jgi:hypothetical protein
MAEKISLEIVTPRGRALGVSDIDMAVRAFTAPLRRRVYLRNPLV